MKIINKTLVKFKHIEDHPDNNYIEAIYPLNPVQTIQLLKEVDYIRLNNEFYTYEYCEFEPSTDKEILDVLYIYVEGYDDDGLN